MFFCITYAFDVRAETPKKWDINYYAQLQRRSRQEGAQLLMLTECHTKRDTSKQAAVFRYALCRKF